LILGILGPQQSAIFSPRAKPLTGRHFAPMPGGRLQAASDATRTEAVALVEGEGAPGGDNDLTNRFRKIASSLSHDWQIRLSWSGRRLVLAGPSE
jgi:hypothetical protein